MRVAIRAVLSSLATFGLLVKFSFANLSEEQRIFSIDHENNTFLMDGKPFQYVSGSFHYFRALPGAWSHRLKTMRAAGLNSIDTYVEWSLHNPREGVYKWDGIADVENFIELAWSEGFYVILRPGPYICAERDNGGLPHWLFTKYPNIKLRTNDSDYTREVRIWYSQLMPRMQRFLYGNGGPIIMVQVENEYAAFGACDNAYLEWLRDETDKYVDNKAVLFTTDIPDQRIHCGKIEGVFATTDFGFDRIHEVDSIWKILRAIQPTGPLVNSEFYPGWLTHWQEENQRRDGQQVADALKIMLKQGANVNFYMFFGGTNFGYTAGANDFGTFKYTADITSYDYDAPMDEAGGVTTKYELIRQVITEHFGLTNLPSVPTPAKRLAYGEIELEPIAKLLSQEAKRFLARYQAKTSTKPKTFEELDQYSGLVLYQTKLPEIEMDPTLLTIHDLHDRAWIFVDQYLVGTLSRGNNVFSVPISGGLGSTLQILVENQGRINFNVANDTKGILGAVTLKNLSGEEEELNNWSSTGFPLEEEDMAKLIEANKEANLTPLIEDQSTPVLEHGPTIYYGEFKVNEIGDTYLNTVGWGKGVAFVNGFNLGRYWPLVGPQLTLYVPNEILKMGTNELVLLEYQRANRSNDTKTITAKFENEAQLDG